MKKFTALTVSSMLALSLLGGTCVYAADETEASTEVASSMDGSDYKVALCVTSLVNDGSWSQVAYEGLVKAEKELGVQTSYAENCQPADMEAILTDYASQGYNLIIGHSFMFGDPAMSVSERYPDVHFAITEGTVGSDNVASYNIGTHELAYLCGVLAAQMTKTNKLGCVMGVQGPAIVKCAEGFKLGAKSINPDIKIEVSYTGSFDDAAIAKEAALAMADDGVDFIMSGCNSAGSGVIKACEERGILCIGESRDMNSEAPDTVVTSEIFDFTRLIYQSIVDEVSGNFVGGARNVCLKDDPEIAKFAPYHGFEDKIPDEVKKSVEDARAKIESGELIVPIIEEPTED